MSEREKFLQKTVGRRHERVNPCFMTGKGCVYTEVIDEALRDQSRCQGFMIMPFKPKLKVIYKNCLKPFFVANYGNCSESGGARGPTAGQPQFEINRADDVGRPGIIICEGICKKIQESDFIVADVSLPNDNVFYELGLAFGLGHKIIVVYHAPTKFGQRIASYFKQAGCKPFSYRDLELIKKEDFVASEHIWSGPSRASDSVSGPPEILFFEKMSSGHPETLKNPDPDQRDIDLLFSTHVKSDIGLAMKEIYLGLKSGKISAPKAIGNYLDNIIRENLLEARQLKTTDTFSETRSRIDRAYCLVVRTGRDCHSLAYFWLGYAHARGLNVIPITVDPEEEDPQRKWQDLAFDIRAQRHMIFRPKKADQLQGQLKRTLREMIRSDFAEWSRKRFWQKILGSRGEVSIITGALHSTGHGREMIGDWDLRAASELTSYFSSHQYQPKIETPIYQLEFAKQFRKGLTAEDYISQVIDDIELGTKNCIIIASPDVNPLTEIIFGKLYRVPDEKLFSNSFNMADHTEAILVCKQRKIGTQIAASSNSRKSPRAFFEETVGSEEFEQRGFASRRLSGDRKLLPYFSQEKAGSKPFAIYAHLVVAPNPFTPQDRETRYVIVLNGVSGPATFALTHVLTGAAESQFASYSDNFEAAAESEKILNGLLSPLYADGFGGLECVVEVMVGHDPNAEESKGSHGVAYDWRRILGWRVVSDVLGGQREVSLLG